MQVGLEGGGHDLLDESLLADRAGTPAELGDGQHIEVDRRGGHETDFRRRGLRVGAGEIDRFRKLESEPFEEARE